MTRAARSISPWVTGFVFLVIAIPFLGFLPAAARQAPEREHFEADRPEARAAWFSAARQAPAGSQPRAWYYMHAWRHAQMMPRLIPGRTGNRASGRMSAHMATLSGNWTELGPRPENSGQYGAVAGRVTAVAVDSGKDPSGNTIYIGTAYGGLWKSTNALSANPTFTPIGDTMPTLAVGAIALDSSTSPTKIYVGTGEANSAVDSYYGVGILSSTDGGHTWTIASHDTQSHSFFGLTWSRILVDPVNPYTVLAAASYSGDYLSQGGRVTTFGLFVSNDGGLTFTPKITGPPCTDLVYDSQTHTYYAVFAGNGIQASSDQGATWKIISNPFVNGVKPSGTNFARASLAARGSVLSVLIANPDGKPSTPTACPVTVTSTTACDTGLAQSSDGGNTWTPVAIPGSKPSTSKDSLFCADPNNCQGNFDQYVAMPAGTNDLVIGGIDAFRMSGGSGLTAAWTNLTQSYGSGTVHPDEHAFASNADGSVWFIGNDGGIWRSTDKGASWTNLNASLGVIQFISVSADLGQNGVYFGGSQDNGTALSDPANALIWNLIWGGDGGYTFDNPAQTQQYFSENPGFEIVRSDDGGKNFVDVVDADTITDPAEFYVPYAFSPDFTQAYVATTKVWQGPSKPTSPGNGWKAISGDLTGTVCNQISPSFLSAIAVAPSDPNTIYVGSSTGTASLSTNAASAQPVWQSQLLGCEIPVGAIAVDPANPKIAYATLQGFLGSGDDHVYATTNGGNSWSPIGNGLPDVPVNSIVIDPNTPQNLFIGTDTGVFVTSDGGSDVLAHPVAWSQLGTGLPATAVLQLKLAPENGTQTLIAATHGRGAWTIPAAAPPNFALSTDQATYYVPVTDSQVQFALHVHFINGESAPVHLQCSPLNSDTTCSFSTSTVSASGDVMVTVGWPAGTTGDRNIQITGNDGINQHQLSPTVIIQDFQIITFSATGLNLEYGSSIDIPVQLMSMYGWNEAVTLACPGLPSGFSCTANPASFSSLKEYTNPQATVTLSASAGASAQSPLQVSLAAQSASLTRTVMVSVNIAHFHLSVPSTHLNVIVGATGLTTTVTAMSASNSTEPITLSCQSPVKTIQCSFNPAVIQPGQSSTVTVSGLITKIGSNIYTNSFTISGTSASDTTLSPQINVNTQDFQIARVQGQSLVGADTAQGSIDSFNMGGYTAPVTLTCIADQGVQCSVPAHTASGTAETPFVLTGLAHLPTGTVINVTVQASNSDLQRTGTGTVTIDDFTVVPSDTAITLRPGYATGSTLISLDWSPGVPLPQTVFSCNAASGIVCKFNIYNPMQAYLTADITQYLKAGGALPVNLQLSASATQSGTTVTHSVTIPVEAQDFSLIGPSNPVVVTAGQSTDFTVKVDAINNFMGSAQFHCDGAPAGSTCTANGVTSVPGTVSFHITTTARGQAHSGGSQARALPPPLSRDDWPTAAPELAGSLFCLLSMLAAGLMVKRGRRRVLLLSVGFGCLLLLLAGCGGGGGGGGGGYTPPSGGTPTPTGTPAGTSTLTITGIYTDPNTPSGSVTISHKTTVTLTVQ